MSENPDPALPDRLPRMESVEDVILAVSGWMETATPSSDEAILESFLADIADGWGVPLRRGDRQAIEACFRSCATADATERPILSQFWVEGLEVGCCPEFWVDAGVIGAVIEPKVCGYMHFIGKLGDDQFLLVGHARPR